MSDEVKKGGRPTKLNRKRHDEAVEYASGGSSTEDIAAHLGVVSSTIHRWLKIGKRARINRDEHGIRIPPAHRAMARFSMEVSRASAEYRRVLHGCVVGAAVTGDPRAALALLKVSDRATYGDHQRTEVSGPDGGPVVVSTMTVGDAIAGAIAATPGLVLDDE